MYILGSSNIKAIQERTATAYPEISVALEGKMIAYVGTEDERLEDGIAKQKLSDQLVYFQYVPPYTVPIHTASVQVYLTIQSASGSLIWSPLPVTGGPIPLYQIMQSADPMSKVVDGGFAIQTGSQVDLPKAFAYKGMLYFALDTNMLFAHNGQTWVDIAGGGGGGATGLGPVITFINSIFVTEPGLFPGDLPRIPWWPADDPTADTTRKYVLVGGYTTAGRFRISGVEEITDAIIP